MSRTITITGTFTELEAACEAAAKHVALTIEVVKVDGTKLYAALGSEGYKVGQIVPDNTSFGGAVLTIDTGWCEIETIVAILEAVGR